MSNARAIAYQRRDSRYPYSPTQACAYTSRYLWFTILYTLEAWRSSRKFRGPELSQSYQYIGLTGDAEEEGGGPGGSLVAAHKGKMVR